MLTLQNHSAAISAVIYFSHKNLKHRFFFLTQFPNLQYGTCVWTETLELHALKLLCAAQAYQMKCTCVGLHTVSLHVSLQTTPRITGEQRWIHGAQFLFTFSYDVSFSLWS